MNWPRNSQAGALCRELAKRRRQLGICQLELDDRLGCADGYIAKIEVGLRRPSAPLLCDWARALGGSIRVEWPAEPQRKRSAA